MLATALGLEASWSKLKDIRGHLLGGGGGAASTRDVSTATTAAGTGGL